MKLWTAQLAKAASAPVFLSGLQRVGTAPSRKAAVGSITHLCQGHTRHRSLLRQTRVSLGCECGNKGRAHLSAPRGTPAACSVMRHPRSMCSHVPGDANPGAQSGWRTPVCPRVALIKARLGELDGCPGLSAGECRASMQTQFFQISNLKIVAITTWDSL